MLLTLISVPKTNDSVLIMASEIIQNLPEMAVNCNEGTNADSAS